MIAIAAGALLIWLLAGYPFEFAMSVGIAVLVISCPCALGLATPVAIMVGTGKGAENGILFKSARTLETAHSLDVVVLDKTGTITEGKPRVTDVFCGSAVSEDELISIAASLEKPSEHPLAEAILAEARCRNILIKDIRDFSAIPGRGVEGMLDENKYYAGNLQLMYEKGIQLNGMDEKGSQLAQEGKSLLFFADAAQVLGLVAVADVVKPTSRQAIEAFIRLGLEVVMLTGDNKRTAEAIKNQLGISRAIAEVMPQDKEREIAALQAAGRKVAMVGDGINDAPALARADVGIAIGAGTDIAIESADIVLMKSDLLDAVTTVELSRAVLRNIRQNLFWAFFYNVIGIPVAAGAFYLAFGLKLNPMIAAAAMSLSSVFVVTNALRLRLFVPKNKKSGKSGEAQACPAQSFDPKMKGEYRNMEKTMLIEGMTCAHCKARVEKALNAIPGVKARVDLEAKKAYIEISGAVADDELRRAVEDAGYEVLEIQ